MILLVIALTTTVVFSSIVFLILDCRIRNLKDQVDYLEDIVSKKSISDFNEMITQDVKFGGF